MKNLFPAVASVVLLAAASGTTVLAAPPSPPAEDGLPKPVPVARYAALAKGSLFAPPTAAAIATPPPPPQPTWAEGWRLTSLAEIGADRFRLALTRSKPSNDNKTLDRIIVTTGENNSEGISLAGVQWSAQPGQTRVTLNRAGVFAVFNFDPANLQSSPQGASGSVPSARAGNIPAPSGTPMPMAQPPPQMPQRAGTRTGPISGAPPGPPPPPRVLQSPQNPLVAPGKPEDEDE